MCCHWIMQLFAIVYFVLYDLLTLSCAHPYTDIQARIHSTFTYTCTHTYYIHSTTTSIDRYSHHIHLCTQHIGGIQPTTCTLYMQPAHTHIIHTHMHMHTLIQLQPCSLNVHILTVYQGMSSFSLSHPWSSHHLSSIAFFPFTPFSLPSILPLPPAFPSPLCCLAPHLSLPLYLLLPCHFLAL